VCGLSGIHCRTRGYWASGAKGAREIRGGGSGCRRLLGDARNAVEERDRYAEAVAQPCTTARRSSRNRGELRGIWHLFAADELQTQAQAEAVAAAAEEARARWWNSIVFDRCPGGGFAMYLAEYPAAQRIGAM